MHGVRAGYFEEQRREDLNEEGEPDVVRAHLDLVTLPCLLGLAAYDRWQEVSRGK